jgi:hypothetical protein
MRSRRRFRRRAWGFRRYVYEFPATTRERCYPDDRERRWDRTKPSKRKVTGAGCSASPTSSASCIAPSKKRTEIAIKPFATSAAFTASRRSTRCQVQSGCDVGASRSLRDFAIDATPEKEVRRRGLGEHRVSMRLARAMSRMLKTSSY